MGLRCLTPDQLQRIESTLAGLTDSDRDALIAQLRIGVQWNTEVTLPGAGHRVTQVYCSALPITYSHIPTDKWERFAQLILDATYEATLTCAALNAQHSSNRMVFLTPLGGGAFGNPEPWIIDAVSRSLAVFASTDLHVAMVSYGQSIAAIQSLVEQYPPAA